jgi:hypothetical protein
MTSPMPARITTNAHSGRRRQPNGYVIHEVIAGDVTIDQGISRELGLSEVISKTFNLYRRNIVNYVIVFAVVELIYGIITTAITQSAIIPALPTNPSSQQFANWLSSSLGTLIAAVALIAVVGLVVFPIAEGSIIKMASEEIQTGKAELGPSVRFAASKLLSMWAVWIITGIIISLGLIALVIPGIILAIMFSLVLPALLIENTGVFGSLGRSRELVGHRWLKTFATFLVLGIIIVIIAIVLSLFSLPFGPASSIVSSLLSSLYQPLLPIALTVYFYSNRARIAPTQVGRASMGPAPAMSAPGMKFCPNCGGRLLSSATYCSNCGAKQPA